jgi:hypothetical protein
LIANADTFEVKAKAYCELNEIREETRLMLRKSTNDNEG